MSGWVEAGDVEGGEGVDRWEDFVCSGITLVRYLYLACKFHQERTSITHDENWW